MLKPAVIKSFCLSKNSREFFNRSRFRAFTLVEILVTIGIIGVVAALTIPVLMQNSNSKKFVTQFKKSLSTLNQAAIGAQAQYDMDYSNLTEVNEDPTCKNDTIAGGKYSLCGLFNNTLAAQTYLGKYGNVKGINDVSPYSATVSSININNFLFFSFSDGAFVGFNPNAKECGVGVGNVITTDMIKNGKLSNCLGYIDVNGPNPPNREVSCSSENTELSTNTTCKVTSGSMGDIFPVVFHDGMVEPATNASLAAFLGGNGKEKDNDEEKADPYNGMYYTNEDGVKVGLKLLTNDDGSFLKMTGNDIKNNLNSVCPEGTKIPDKDTLLKIVRQNLGQQTGIHGGFPIYEHSREEVGALGLPATVIGQKNIFIWSSDSESPWHQYGVHAWGGSGSAHVSNSAVVLCIENK